MVYLENGNSEPMRTYGGKQVVNLLQNRLEFAEPLIQRVKII